MARIPADSHALANRSSFGPGEGAYAEAKLLERRLFEEGLRFVLTFQQGWFSVPTCHKRSLRSTSSQVTGTLSEVYLICQVETSSDLSPKTLKNRIKVQQLFRPKTDVLF
jgi:hypothetical protein